MTEPEASYLPAEGNRAFLGAAGYLAVLSYPEDRGKRDRFVDAVRAHHTKRAIAADAHTFHINPDLRSWRTRDINNEMSKAHRRVQQRLLAAHSIMFRWLGPSGPGDRWLAGARAETGIRHNDARPLRDTLDTQTEAARRRYWKPSLPVLHLALALREHLASQPDSLRFDQLLEDPHWVAPALTRAENLREQVEARWPSVTFIQILPE